MFLDLTDVKSSSFDPIVDGEYHVQIDKAEVVTNGDAQTVKATLKILDGEFSNRTVFADFWIKHTNPKAVSVGKEKLKNLCEASGKPVKLESVTDLVGGMCIVKLKNETYNEKTYPKASYFKKIDNKTDDSASVFS